MSVITDYILFYLNFLGIGDVNRSTNLILVLYQDKFIPSFPLSLLFSFFFFLSFLQESVQRFW